MGFPANIDDGLHNCQSILVNGNCQDNDEPDGQAQLMNLMVTLRSELRSARDLALKNTDDNDSSSRTLEQKASEGNAASERKCLERQKFADINTV